MRGRTGGMAACSHHGDRSRCVGVWRWRFRAPAGYESGRWQAGGEISVAGCTPQNPLIPANTSEVCGGDIVGRHRRRSWSTTTPRTPPPRTTSPSPSRPRTTRTSPSSSSRYKFHDGTEVKAKNFVDAWNYTAYGPNGQPAATSSSRSPATPTCSAPDRSDCKGKPKAKTMSGLKVVDDHTFTIKTTEPGVEPAGAARLLGLRAAAGLVLRRPEGLREEADRRRAVQARQQDRHRDRVLEVRRLLRQAQAQRGQADLPDLPATRRRPTTTSWRTTSTYIDDSNIPPDQFIGDAYKTRPPRPELAARGRPDPMRSRSPRSIRQLKDIRAAQGHLDGHRPRSDHQADLQRHGHAG